MGEKERDWERKGETGRERERLGEKERDWKRRETSRDKERQRDRNGKQTFGETQRE